LAPVGISSAAVTTAPEILMSPRGIPPPETVFDPEAVAAFMSPAGMSPEDALAVSTAAAVAVISPLGISPDGISPTPIVPEPGAVISPAGISPEGRGISPNGEVSVAGCWPGLSCR
jgi:hypothetical protein